MQHWIALAAMVLFTADDALPTSSGFDLGAVDVPHAASTVKKVRASSFKGALQPWPFDAWSQNDTPQHLGIRAMPDGSVDAVPGGVPLAGNTSDMSLQLNVGQFYSFLRQLPAGGSYEQSVRRLGLERLQSVRAEGKLLNLKSATLAVDITGSVPDRSVLKALGPALSPQWPAVVPPGAAFSAISVQPASMWIVVETVLAGLWPLEYSLAQVQIDQLEQQAGKRWGEDILGSAPRLWCAYEAVSKRGVDRVAVLQVADGIAAARFLKDALAVISDVAQHVTVKSGEKSKMPTLSVQDNAGHGMYFAFAAEAIVAASSAAALDTHLAAHRKVGPLVGAGSAPAVAFGSLDNGAALRHLAALVPPQKEIPAALGRSVWTFAEVAGGWHLDVAARGP